MNRVFILGAGFSRRYGGPLLREMFDLTIPANRKAVGHLWKTSQFKALSSVLRRLPSEEQDIEGLFNYVSNAAFYGGRIGNYSPRTLLDFLTSYVAELIEVRTTQSYEPHSDEVYAHFVDDVLNNKPS